MLQRYVFKGHRRTKLLGGEASYRERSPAMAWGRPAIDRPEGPERLRVTARPKRQHAPRGAGRGHAAQGTFRCVRTEFRVALCR